METQTSLEVASMKDNQIASFTLGEGAVRGRIIRLGQALDQVLGGDRYPEPVARILGEAVMVSALVATALKFDGKLIVQALGTNDGAVSMLVAETTTGGDMRAYARFDDEMLAKIIATDSRPDFATLMGGGTMAMTIDQGAKAERYQGLAAIESGSLSDAIEHYFAQSEQVPTFINMAVGQLQTPDQDEQWRGAGLLVQRIADDAVRASSSESWAMTEASMNTLGADELLDPDLSSERLLYRLFHEQGVRVEPPRSVRARCSCSKQRLLETLKTFDEAAIQDMMVDGKITARCEFCQTDHEFFPADLGAPE